MHVDKLTETTYSFLTIKNAVFLKDNEKIISFFKQNNVKQQSQYS